MQLAGDIESMKVAGKPFDSALDAMRKLFGCPVLTNRAQNGAACFFPKLGIMQKGNPAQAVKSLTDKDFPLGERLKSRDEQIKQGIRVDKFLSRCEEALEDAVTNSKGGFTCCFFGPSTEVRYLTELKAAYSKNDIEVMKSAKGQLGEPHAKLCDEMINPKEGLKAKGSVLERKI